jgi:transposase
MPQRDPAKEIYWRRLLLLWRQSGLTGRDFCAEHRLSEPSFYAWRREIGRRDKQKRATRPPARARVPRQPATTTPAFVKLAIDASAAPAAAIEVVVAESRVLRVRPGFDAALLRQLMRLLEEPSC